MDQGPVPETGDPRVEGRVVEARCQIEQAVLGATKLGRRVEEENVGSCHVVVGVRGVLPKDAMTRSKAET